MNKKEKTELEKQFFEYWKKYKHLYKEMKPCEDKNIYKKCKSA